MALVQGLKVPLFQSRLPVAVCCLCPAVEPVVARQARAQAADHNTFQDTAPAAFSPLRQDRTVEPPAGPKAAGEPGGVARWVLGGMVDRTLRAVLGPDAVLAVEAVHRRLQVETGRQGVSQFDINRHHTRGLYDSKRG